MIENIIPGTTPNVQYNLPFSAELINRAEFTIEYFAGSKKELILKTLKDSAKGERSLSFALTEEETLNFPDGSYLSMQLQVWTTSGKTLATNPKRVEVGRQQRRGVIK